ncbi:MAG: glycosyl hydrolase family 28 protein [Anaerolineae bacterium]|nr:glycosyl hydrolase family 28 protein [Anaerolineae bacterium]
MLITFFNCQDVTVRDILVKDSASWGVHFVACDTVWVEGVRVNNRARPNGDGLDLESCRNAFISNCHIDCDDDAICLKSSIANHPCENITVTNCIISSNTAAVKFGTPSRGGFRNITISNCAFYDCGMGAIKLLSVDGGMLDNVTITNIAMQNVEGPIFMRLGNRNSRFNIPGFSEDNTEPEMNQDTGVLRNVSISHIEAVLRPVEVKDPMQRVEVDPKTKQGIFITGIPGHIIENITLSDIHVTFPGGGTREEADINVPEDASMYPEQFFFGKLPAYGAFIRHVKGIKLDNVHFDLARGDLRPALVCESVQDLELAGFRATGSFGAPLIRFKQVQDVFIHHCRPQNEAGVFVQVAGKADHDILLESNDLRKAKIDIERIS